MILNCYKATVLNFRRIVKQLHILSLRPKVYPNMVLGLISLYIFLWSGSFIKEKLYIYELVVLGGFSLDVRTWMQLWDRCSFYIFLMLNIIEEQKSSHSKNTISDIFLNPNGTYAYRNYTVK